MGRWKTKSPKKLSLRQREKLLNVGGGAMMFGEIPQGRRVAFTNAVDKFIREGSCRHMQSLGNQCESFDNNAEGKCKRDGRLCDQLTEKGEQYRREYE